MRKLPQSSLLAMHASDPAAGTTHTFVYHLIAHHDDMFLPRLRLGHRCGPADPLVAGQRSDVFPHSEHGLVGQDCLAHIGRQFVYRTG